METTIIEAYGSAEYSGREVRASGEQFRSLAHPWALTTLDGWTRHPVHGWIPLEVKNVGSFAADRWVDSVPIEMLWQCRWHALVLDAPCVTIAACVGGSSLMWEDIPRDPEADRILRERGHEFWRCVKEDRVPLHVPTLASVKALYPGPESGRVLLSSEEWAPVDARLREIKDAQRSLEKERDALEAKLKNAIGDHEVAELGDGVSYSLRSQTRKEVVQPESTFRVLRRHVEKKGS
mgnify:CR=1 FL=1